MAIQEEKRREELLGVPRERHSADLGGSGGDLVQMLRGMCLSQDTSRVLPIPAHCHGKQGSFCPGLKTPQCLKTLQCTLRAVKAAAGARENITEGPKNPQTAGKISCNSCFLGGSCSSLEFGC